MWGGVTHAIIVTCCLATYNKCKMLKDVGMVVKEQDCNKNIAYIVGSSEFTR